MKNSISISIQGIAGSFHEVAAKHFFSSYDPSIVECATFKQTIAAVGDRAEVGVIAIENTIAGSLLPNYELLRRSNLSIIGEYKLRIEHSLCALPGVAMEEIDEVQSHPIAIMQCGDFLEQYPELRVLEKDDTASSARRIARSGVRHAAAICSHAAAELYGLNVLYRGIETNKHNYTRFLVVAPKDSSLCPRQEVCNKSSILFSLQHNEGSLSQVLAILSFYGMNLTKIQSMPIIGKEWEYLFYIDLSFENFERYEQSIQAILPLTNDLQRMGEYIRV